MHRFYLPRREWTASSLILKGGEADHALSVLRLKVGDKVVVFDGEGGEATAAIEETAKHELTLRPLFKGKTDPLRCAVTLAQAIPKGKNMDLIVQKAVELGVARIAPLLSDRTIARIGDDEASKKQAKWQATAIEACKQCGRNWLPEVMTPRSVSEFLSDVARSEWMLIASLQGDALPLKKVLEDFASAHGRLPTSVTVLIGPEGDFTPAEIALAKSHDCRPITLGPVILRTETAAIYSLSVLSHELQG